MTMTSERRYIVYHLDWTVLSGVARSVEQGYRSIEQGYFETPPHDILRVRITDKCVAELARKTGIGRDRTLHAKECALDVGKFLFECCPYRLKKRRYFHDGWKVDVFDPPLDGLVVAERATDGGREVVLPPWIRDAKEVTDSLTNLHLARAARDLEEERGDKPLREFLIRRIPRIVLTGGPCSGKSTIMALLAKEIGDVVHCVPEVATIVIEQVGAKPPVGNPLAARRFQRALARVQRIFETVSEGQAINDAKRALLLDRGVIDGAAYMPGGLKELEYVLLSSVAAEYAEYDMVLYLETPPAEIYDANKDNNAARFETYDQAAALGEKIRDAWSGHPNFRLIPNGASWNDKVDAVRAVIASFLKR